jgi:hypothetical protein
MELMEVVLYILYIYIYIYIYIVTCMSDYRRDLSW